MSMMKLIIGQDQWMEEGSEADPGSRLLAGGLEINGQWFHVEALAVHDVQQDGYAVQDVADEAFREYWEGLGKINDCRFTTQQIKGREYVIFITPHGE